MGSFGEENGGECRVTLAILRSNLPDSVLLVIPQYLGYTMAQAQNEKLDAALQHPCQSH